MANQLVPPITAGRAFEFEWLNLSTADLIVVGLMVVVFVAALLIPFPGGHDQ